MTPPRAPAPIPLPRPGDHVYQPHPARRAVPLPEANGISTIQHVAIR
jgi:hypothetical protein